MRAHAIVLTLVLLGCGEPPLVTHSYELSVTGIAYDYGEGRRGLNLDGRVSDDSDAVTCSQTDIVDPVDGEEGVDNALATPPDRTIGEYVEPMPFDEPRLESLVVAARADLSRAKELEIALGTVELPEVEVVDGRFRGLAGPERTWTIDIPVDDAASLALLVRGPALKGRITESGEIVELVIGGRVDIEETVAATLEAAPDVDPTLIRTTLEGIADLDPDEDGDCQSVSVAFLAEVTD